MVPETSYEQEPERSSGVRPGSIQKTTVTGIEGSYVRITSLKGDEGNTTDKWVGGSKCSLKSKAWAEQDEEYDLEHLGEGNPTQPTSPEPIPPKPLRKLFY